MTSNDTGAEQEQELECHLNGLLLERCSEVPHHCADPQCPGGQNRRKLELWDEMRWAIEAILVDRPGAIENAQRVVAQARALQEPSSEKEG